MMMPTAKLRARVARGAFYPHLRVASNETGRTSHAVLLPGSARVSQGNEAKHSRHDSHLREISCAPGHSGRSQQAHRTCLHGLVRRSKLLPEDNQQQTRGSDNALVLQRGQRLARATAANRQAERAAPISGGLDHRGNAAALRGDRFDQGAILRSAEKPLAENHAFAALGNRLSDRLGSQGENTGCEFRGGDLVCSSGKHQGKNSRSALSDSPRNYCTRQQFSDSSARAARPVADRPQHAIQLVLPTTAPCRLAGRSSSQIPLRSADSGNARCGGAGYRLGGGGRRAHGSGCPKALCESRLLAEFGFIRGITSTLLNPTSIISVGGLGGHVKPGRPRAARSGRGFFLAVSGLSAREPRSRREPGEGGDIFGKENHEHPNQIAFRRTGALPM